MSESMAADGRGAKHIGLFLPILDGGGAERVFLHLTAGLLAKGHRVDLVLTRAGGRLIREVPEGARVVDLGGRRNIFSLFRLIRYIRRDRPDYLISSLNTCNIVAAIARRIGGCKTRVILRQANTFSETLSTGNPLMRKILFQAVRRCYPMADGIIAVSRGVADDLKDFCGIPERLIRVVYNPVVIPEPSLDSVENPTDWLLPGGPPVILGAGKLEPQKDFVTLIRAFDRVRKVMDARLIILGEGSQREKLERLVKELGLEDLVRMPGFVLNPFFFMRRASVFVLSSAWEGLPNVLLQALGCGCPVVSTDCRSGPREILRDGELGDLVPVGDDKMLAEKICRVLNNRTDPQPLVDRALDFSVERICSEYLEMCR